MRTTKFDAARVDDESVREAPARDCRITSHRCNEACGDEARPGATAHHDHMQAATSALGSASYRRELELTLADADEHEPAPVLLGDAIELQFDGERANAAEQADRNRDGRIDTKELPKLDDAPAPVK